MQVLSSVQNGNLVLEIHGEINVSTVGRFSDSFSEAQSRSGINNIVLDMREVSVIDSCGLGALISAQRSVQGRSGSIRLAGLRSGVMEMLRITKLDERFECFDNVEAALDGTPEPAKTLDPD